MLTTPNTPNTAANPCATCGACCRSYVVPVYGHDVWQLATRQRLSPESFVVVVPEKAPRPEAFRLQAEGQPFSLALDKKGTFHMNRPCVFLMELPGGNARCGVYAERPIVCQTYPMSLWSGVVAQRKDTLCPPDSWPLAQVVRPHWHEKLRRLVFRLDIYGEIVARWNARVAALPSVTFVLPEFLAYMLNVYERLDAMERELGEETMGVVEGSWPAFPRPAVDAELVTRFAAQVPWLGYFARARAVIDSFYSQIPAQPPAMRANADPTASEQPA